MVPYSWVVECLRMFGVGPNVIGLMEPSMPN